LIVQLKLYSILREKLPPDAKGQTDLELEEGETLSGLLDRLEISRRVVISINGEHVTDRSHRLQDGDEIKIFSSISGG
jgi:thiamine biosynthesis protein ThiS